MPKRKAIQGLSTVAVAYLRVSTEDQRLGPEAQRAQIEAWAARGGVVIAEWFSDIGVSGAAPLAARPAMMAALASLRGHKAGVLVVAKRDRLARDVVVAASIVRAAKTGGALVVSAAGEGNGDSPADEFMRGMIDLASQYELGLIGARIKAALGVKKARGESMGKTAFGYARDGLMLVPDPREQATLARARELREGGAALRAIVSTLTSEGHASRTGKPYGLTQVAHMVPRAA